MVMNYALYMNSWELMLTTVWLTLYFIVFFLPELLTNADEIKVILVQDNCRYYLDIKYK